MPDFQQVKNQVLALIFNIISWGRHIVSPRPKLVKNKAEGNYCVEIGGPGGLDQLQLRLGCREQALRRVQFEEGGASASICDSDPAKTLDEQIHESLVLVDIEYFSVNYADVCITWGPHESALRYVGWPIVPGFDFSGKVTWVGSQVAKEGNFKAGDIVFGVSLFGSYSRKVLVPTRQLVMCPRLRQRGGKLLSQAQG